MEESMKALLINGSPNEAGCTFTALSEVAGALNRNGVDSEIFHIGKGPVYGCAGCRACLKLNRCVLDGDVCNELAERAKEADAMVIGSPVYYAGANGALCALLDRMFFSSRSSFEGKPGAAVVSCRRGGAGSAFDRLNKYFTINGMPVVSSQYWNSVHGNKPEEVMRDAEGLQTMRTLGANMAWLMKSLEAAKGSVQPPEREARVATNFIRDNL
jgi:multimeric flavodoxin WrbA